MPGYSLTETHLPAEGSQPFWQAVHLQVPWAYAVQKGRRHCGTITALWCSPQYERV